MQLEQEKISKSSTLANKIKLIANLNDVQERQEREFEDLVIWM